MAQPAVPKLVLYEDYPNFHNEAFPNAVFCAYPENAADAALAFKRYCPRDFKIKAIRYAQNKKKPICEWHVDYALKNGTNLPPDGPQLKNVFDKLCRFSPMDAWVNERKITTPNIATIVYRVVCWCERPDPQILVEDVVTKKLHCLSISNNNNDWGVMETS